jgi:DNA-binding CsgD family transcriptional regulator
MKYLLRSLFILVISSFFMCGPSEQEHVLTIDEKEMVNLMVDLRIIENQIKKHHVLDRDSVSQHYRALFFKIHDIDSVSLTANISALQNNPRLAKKIEDEVLKRISDIQEEKGLVETK